MINTELKESDKTVRKIICNPFRYIDLYALQKMLRNSENDIPAETKEMIIEAIKEKLVDEDNEFKKGILSI